MLVLVESQDGPDIIDPYGDVDEGDDEPEEDGEHDSMDV